MTQGYQLFSSPVHTAKSARRQWFHYTQQGAKWSLHLPKKESQQEEALGKRALSSLPDSTLAGLWCSPSWGWGDPLAGSAVALPAGMDRSGISVWPYLTLTLLAWHGERTDSWGELLKINFHMNKTLKQERQLSLPCPVKQKNQRCVCRITVFDIKNNEGRKQHWQISATGTKPSELQGENRLLCPEALEIK